MYFNAQLAQGGEMAKWAIPDQFHHLIVDGKFSLDATVLADLSKPAAAPGTGATLPEQAPVPGRYPQQWTANGTAAPS